MKALILSSAVWGGAFGAAFVGLVLSGSSDPSIAGTIVLDFKPFCSSFVVRTEREFVLLTWEDGILVFAEGDHVTGPLRIRGIQSIDLVGYGQMKAYVEGWSPDLASAQHTLRTRCALTTEKMVPEEGGM
ncbi:hypothetical protein [Microvirga massiliensis]|uniref:hypothetical protein n=1 Tax=Microvirga massiliensis TaxID=1033741 RepID=UPI00062B9969|nr:hypothetical protein [Microvirga massiliensis]